MYEKYNAMVYGIALELATTEAAAEQILISTFQKFNATNFYTGDPECICITLFKLLIQSARENLKANPKSNFNLKQFESAPLLHNLLCENTTIESYCQENKMTKVEMARIIRLEFNSFR
ncbi:MAG: hypothetical protein ABIO46_16140 [Chitinophagales bacterium]